VALSVAARAVESGPDDEDLAPGAWQRLEGLPDPALTARACPLHRRREENQRLLHARIKALPWRQVPAGSLTRDTGHGRIETRTLKTAHVSRLDFPSARQAIKITRRREDAAAGTTSRETVYAVISLTSAQDPARLACEHWSAEAHHHNRWDVTFSEDTATSRTASGPANLATTKCRRHRGHQRYRLPARPRRPARPHHPRRSPPPPRT
jgi:predicted transposase YbfD/YdcC